MTQHTDRPGRRNVDFSSLSVGEIARRQPELAARMRHAIDAFLGDRRPLACKHIIDGASPVAFLCAEHSAAGLACPACATRHTRRHPETVEFTCDACGGPLGAGWSAGAVWHPTLRAGDTRGRHRILTVPIVVGCLGVCPACWEAAA